MLESVFLFIYMYLEIVLLHAAYLSTALSFLFIFHYVRKHFTEIILSSCI